VGANVNDGRKLDHATLEAIRLRTVRQLEAGSTTVAKAAAALGMSRQAVNQWWRAFKVGGEQALRARPAPGARPKLSAQQQWELGALLHKQPQQLDLDFGLWTRERVRELIRARFGVKLHVTAVGRLLRRLGMSPQRPLWRAWQQNPQAVARWKEQEFPAIRAQARREGARIWFADEASVRTDSHAGTTWAPVGRTPVVRTTGSKASVGMISAVNARGELKFQILDTRLNADTFIGFLELLLAEVDRPIFLVLDNYSVHRSHKVRDFAAAKPERLRLFFLPAYSPELNPDEWVWKNVKRDRIAPEPHTGTGRKARGPLEAKAIAALEWLVARPNLVRTFFRDPHLAYIHAAA
jgi:transposase